VGDHALEYMTGGLAVILGATGRNLGAGMSGGTAYVHELAESQVNRDAIASGELGLLPMDSADAAILKDLLERHVALTDSALAARMLADFDRVVEEFVKVLPRNYAAVLETRAKAADEGLDPDGDTVWRRILQVTTGA
jgi:glutamate synthase (NADPH/NADH) large chain